MKKLITIGLCAMLAFAVTATVTTNFLPETKAGLMLSNIQSLTFDEIVDGGTIPPVVIACSSGNSGDCFVFAAESIGGGECSFYCDYTGKTNDYCSSFLVGVINLCSAMYE